MAAPKTTYEINGKNDLCPTELAIHLVAGRWKSLVIYKLLESKQRYGELKKRIPGISDKMLAEQLKKLEETGLISKTIYPTVPPKVEYELTPLGEGLRATFQHLETWGERFQLESKQQPEA